MRIDVISLFPDFIAQCAAFGVTGRAVERGLLSLHAWNPRDHAEGNYRRVDDRPFGGGPGMVMLIDPLRASLAAARADDPAPARVIYLSPQGAPLTQAKARELAGQERLVLLCGRYEGIDERFIEAEVDEELSIGDYVLSGGELAALVVVDAVSRLVPGVVGDGQSVEEDSFSRGLLDYPHYTRPAVFAGRDVPPVLLSGHHADVRRWRRKAALARTLERRPDLLATAALDDEDRVLLAELRRENLRSGGPSGPSDERSGGPSGSPGERSGGPSGPPDDEETEQ